MNIYVVVEGAVGEKRVYANWIPLVNPSLKQAVTIDEVDNDRFYIISGGGYPNYFDVIESAVADMKEGVAPFDRLVVAVDSEELTFEEKYYEVNEILENSGVEHRIIVQHFCLEAWALGNTYIFRKNPHTTLLKQYRAIFDVKHDDPEMLPDALEFSLNRAQFAERYLRAALQERYRNLTYNKSNPGALLNDKYFRRLKQRLHGTGHIPSFSGFLHAFV